MIISTKKAKMLALLLGATAFACLMSGTQGVRIQATNPHNVRKLNEKESVVRNSLNQQRTEGLTNRNPSETAPNSNIVRPSGGELARIVSDLQNGQKNLENGIAALTNSNNARQTEQPRPQTGGNTPRPSVIPVDGGVFGQPHSDSCNTPPPQPPACEVPEPRRPREPRNPGGEDCGPSRPTPRPPVQECRGNEGNGHTENHNGGGSEGCNEGPRNPPPRECNNPPRPGGGDHPDCENHGSDEHPGCNEHPGHGENPNCGGGPQPHPGCGNGRNGDHPGSGGDDNGHPGCGGGNENPGCGNGEGNHGCGNPHPGCGDDEGGEHPGCGDENPGCGNENPGCGHGGNPHPDHPGCGNEDHPGSGDHPGCGNGRPRCGRCNHHCDGGEDPECEVCEDGWDCGDIEWDCHPRLGGLDRCGHGGIIWPAGGATTFSNEGATVENTNYCYTSKGDSVTTRLQYPSICAFREDTGTSGCNFPCIRRCYIEEEIIPLDKASETPSSSN